ncbi:hypothetical protein GJAV_G00221300 [Gymnothorax javanicus]|nr:hypothetical protein GJAV_G00221300 [Gymnothorax javanicus]
MRVILTDAMRNERTAEAFLSALRDEDPFLFNDLETNGPRKTFVRSRLPTEPFDLWSAKQGLRNFFKTRRDKFKVVDILVQCNLLTVEEYDDIRLARERPQFLVLHEIMTWASPEHVVFGNAWRDCIEMCGCHRTRKSFHRTTHTNRGSRRLSADTGIMTS